MEKIKRDKCKGGNKMKKTILIGFIILITICSMTSYVFAVTDTYNVNMEIIQNTDLTAISDAENFVMLEYLFCNAVLGELD